MVNNLLIFVFIISLFASYAIGSVIFYHFKKFSLTSDAFAKKIIRLFIIGTIALALLSFLFLLLAVI